MTSSLSSLYSSSEDEEYETENDSAENISASLPDSEKTGSVITKSDGFTVCSMLIAGHVEGHSAINPPLKSTKYEHVIPQLIAVEQSTAIDGLLIVLNTVGGDVEAGLAIAELIASMNKPVVSLIIGGGHSIGIPMAVAAKKSFIVSSATMTLHPVRINGLVIGVSQTFSYFKRMQDRITGFITSHSAIEICELERFIYNKDEMAGDVGTIIDGKTAVSCGLIGSLGGLNEALSALKSISKQ